MARLLFFLVGGWLLLSLHLITPSDGAITSLVVDPVSTTALQASWNYSPPSPPNLNITYHVTWMEVGSAGEGNTHNTTSTSYLITNLNECTYYKVTVEEVTEEEPSEKRKTTLLTAPSEVKVGSDDDGTGAISVTWTWDSSTVNSNYVKYKVSWPSASTPDMVSVLTNDKGLVIEGAASEGNVCVQALSVEYTLVSCESKETCKSYKNTPPQSNNTGLIVGLSVGLPLALILLASLAFFLYRRYNTKKIKLPQAPTPIVNLTTWPSSANITPEQALRSSFQSVFANFQHNNQHQTTKIAERHFNKNRFTDILPYDHTLVKLQKVDYINASFVLERNFIATQDPYPDQDDDFWQLLWECNVRVVVRLSTDSITQATARYIDDCGDNNWVMGHEELRVTLVKKENNGMFYRRTLQVAKDTSMRTIEHFHLTNWAEKSAACREQVVRLALAAQEARRTLGLLTPVLIHCGAGVGRTGTFIAVWHLIEAEQTCTPNDVEATVMAMRQSRMSMVQTEEQYVFIYNCVSDYNKNPDQWQSQAELYERPS